jgi:hypothetical protein
MSNTSQYRVMLQTYEKCRFITKNYRLFIANIHFFAVFLTNGNISGVFVCICKQNWPFMFQPAIRLVGPQPIHSNVPDPSTGNKPHLGDV